MEYKQPMRPKYYKATAMDRIRIPVPPNDILEMHRNARIDNYSKEIEQKLKDDLSLMKLNRYPDVDLLYDKLSELHSIPNDNFLITSGIDGGIKTVFEMCTEPNSNIICLTPTYGMYYVYSQAYETNMIEVKSKEHSLSVDLDELLEAIDDTIDVIFIPNPHVPVEHIFSLDDIGKIIQKARESDALVFMDEAYYMFGAPTAIDLVSTYDNLVVARTFSKGMGLPAIRLGYLISNPDFIKFLETKRFAHETNSLTIDIAIWAIEHMDIFEEYIDEVCSTRDWLISELHAKGYKTHGDKSNTILIDLGSKEKADFITDELKREDIWVRGYLPSPVETYILVTVGERTTVEKFYSKLLSSSLS